MYLYSCPPKKKSLSFQIGPLKFQPKLLNRSFCLTGEKKLQDDKPKVVVEKKEPEKPRAVIDVFHGSKHVQETFK